ncbi:MAG: HAMP domain-containing histidine kinase [Acholeplasmatales bacterium]|nr:HAMP domain-containing histidine kinase [Acholeplasmatales bacterium]
MNNKKESFFSNFSTGVFISFLVTSIFSISVTYLGLAYGFLSFTVKDFVLRILVAVLLCVFITIIISMITSRSAKNYNEDLFKAILEASKGNFDYKLNPNDNTLFKDVSIAFNKMSDELSQIEILRSDFISNFSHECRTPINSICNYAELLSEPSLTDEERKEFVDIIIKESRRLNTLSDSILQLANIGVKTAHFEIEEIDMDELIKEIIVENDQKIGNLNLSFAIDPVKIKAREIHIYQIINNLLNNAIKYTKSKIFMSLHEENNIVKFIISDDGIGMSENTIAHIYDVSFQADKSHNNGCGLGMSIVKKIIDFEGYELEIISELDKGSTFILKIDKTKEVKKA